MTKRTKYLSSEEIAKIPRFTPRGMQILKLAREYMAWNFPSMPIFNHSNTLNHDQFIIEIEKLFKEDPIKKE